MEVMRFDDQAKDHGKIHATKIKESNMLEELKGLDLENVFPNLEKIVVNGNSNLQTDEDHNYVRFRDNFIRVISKHSKKVVNYRKNHPGFKLIFFIFDESSGIYFENKNTFKSKLKVGAFIEAKPHFYWVDSSFIQAIKNCNADYLIWFKPYNFFETPSGINSELPKIIIYDVCNFQVDTVSYDSNLMISSEV